MEGYTHSCSRTDRDATTVWACRECPNRILSSTLTRKRRPGQWGLGRGYGGGRLQGKWQRRILYSSVDAETSPPVTCFFLRPCRDSGSQHILNKHTIPLINTLSRLPSTSQGSYRLALPLGLLRHSSGPRPLWNALLSFPVFQGPREVSGRYSGFTSPTPSLK